MSGKWGAQQKKIKGKYAKITDVEAIVSCNVSCL